ncbi:SLC13 family permease [Maridesulfovibrio frigidus]|uniref:SLC13 family permease n=1 Tax=Maridesulfovibrio frigidus TaxID=340956 RepID=UPI0004E195C2|nr:SLC13 family permease [Maridesulfovibrio frigidus]
MTSPSYIYDHLPLLLLFATGYILYRVIASVGLPEYFSAKAVRFSRGRVDWLLLSLIFVSAGMSMFIPNAVTVLAMIPVIRKLDGELKSMTTPLTLSIIYGANIGGMGSLIGSPANLLLLGALELFNVEGREQITFFNWFMWALPVVVLFLLLAWIVVRMSIPEGSKRIPAKLIGRPERVTIKQKQGILVFGLFILFWVTTSIIRELSSSYVQIEPAITIAFTAVFIITIFGKLSLGINGTSSEGPLMGLKSLVEGLPKRGLMYLAVLVVVISIVMLFRIDTYVAGWFGEVVSVLPIVEQGGYLLYLITAVVVILLTEVLSNTVVSTAFFAVVVHTASLYGVNPMSLMILVSIASTCAFMTPIATPCNSLAFGEMRKVSLRTMLTLGMVLNICGAVLLSVWVWKVIPYIYM